MNLNFSIQANFIQNLPVWMLYTGEGKQTKTKKTFKTSHFYLHIEITMKK